VDFAYSESLFIYREVVLRCTSGKYL